MYLMNRIHFEYLFKWKTPHISDFQLGLCVRLSASKLKYLQRLKIQNKDRKSTTVNHSLAGFSCHQNLTNHVLNTSAVVMANYMYVNTCERQASVIKYDFIPITSY